MLHITLSSPGLFFFFFNDTATTEIYTLSLHDALPISPCRTGSPCSRRCGGRRSRADGQTHEHGPGGLGQPAALADEALRSEEHTSELQSRLHLVCRLLLEKKKKH